MPELTKALRVGPQSAGADPGPAAYGKGGEQPTVTDANVVLGHLPPRLLGGEMQLDVEARAPPRQTIADAMGLDSVEAAAEGILAIVNENMAGALRLVSVQRGHDPREFALVAYGGAGPLHANAVAKIMGSFPVLVPPAPGLLCAIGDLVADFRDEFAQTYIRVLVATDPAEVADPRRARRARGRVARRRGIAPDAQRHLRRRHALPPARATRSRSRSTRRGVRRDGLADLEERFNGLHEQLYGFRMPGTRRRSSTCAPSASAPCRSRSCRPASPATPTPRAPSSTSTRSSSRASALPTKIYDRAKLARACASTARRS